MSAGAVVSAITAAVVVAAFLLGSAVRVIKQSSAESISGSGG